MPQRGAVGPFGVPVQPKLAIGPARDRFEAEADRAADHVMGSAPGVPAITPLTTAPAMRMAALEEEAAQRAVKDESEEVQRQVGEEEEETLQLQRQAEDEEEEDLLQPKPDGAGAAHAASPSVEAGIRSARGSGSPLPAATRGRMEQGFGRDFSAVRVHDDTRAAQLNEGVNARAFTTGSDIFFARGAYAPGTSSGDRLLSHELAHVAQQTGPGQVQPKRIQRNGNPPAADPASASADPAAEPASAPIGPVFRDGSQSIDTTRSPMLFTLDHIELPRIGRLTKGVSSGVSAATMPASGYRWTGKGSREASDDPGFESATNPAQVELWERPMRSAAGLRTALTNQVQDVGVEAAGQPIYFLRHTGGRRSSVTLIGTIDEMMRQRDVLRPPYSDGGDAVFHDVDHYWEIQLGGAHSIDNLWLLTQAANRSSGGEIKSRNVGAAEALANRAEQQGFWAEASNPEKPSFRSNGQLSWPDSTRVNILFTGQQTFDIQGTGWTKAQIESGAHVSQLDPIDRQKLIRDGLIPGTDAQGNPVRPRNVLVFSSQTTSFRKIVGVNDDDTLDLGGNPNGFIEGFSITSTRYAANLAPAAGDEIASITGRAFVGQGGRGVRSVSDAIAMDVAETTIPVRALAAEGFSGGYMDKANLRTALTSLRATLRGASPITFTDAGLTDDFKVMAGGTVNADNPLFPGFTFDIRITGNAIFIDAPIPTDRLSFYPFRVTEASLQIGFDDQGLFFGGTAGFAIDRVGSGTIETRRLTLAGTFDFDIDAFNPAQLSVAYADRVWSGSATLGIKPGTIPFVESGTITAGFGENGFSIDGTANLAGPGIPEGTSLTIAYNQETGEFTFGGDVPLDTSRLPGLTNARVGFTVTRAEAGDYRVAGEGSADFALAGISGTVDIGYDNGIITANGEAAVNRPPLTGSANFHLSNQAVGDDGQPIEGPPLDTFRAWGGGTASIQFGRYITGTAGIQFLENGEIELMGQIALPPTITLIEATEYHYDIFTFPEVRFPIIGFTIPVINRSFGVFGFIRGGLDATLTLGPGELVDTQVTVTYNPDQPEDMSITGGSTFQIGASADVGLRVTGGIGAGLAIVEATGEVGLRGALGLELSGGASVMLNWTPTDGLSIDASVFGEAQPTFSISVVADARVVVDAFLWSGTLWNESWERELASIGPDMRWRAELPASWSERDGLDVDINNLELTYPDIDLRGLASDVFEAII